MKQISTNRPAQPVLVFLTLFLSLVLAACAGKEVKIGNLYQRLGGEDAVGKIVDDAVLYVQADPRIRDRFKNADLARLKARLTEQLCELGGGPCNYSGLAMSAAHQGMKITNIEFDAFIGNLAKALDKHEVGPTEQRELLFALKAMRGEVMGLEN